MADGGKPLRNAENVRFGQLSESLGFLLRLSQLQSFADFYEGLGELGIRPGEISVLMMLADNPGIRQGVLARALMIKRAHMAKMIRGMEEAGLVTRTVPEDDRRAVQIWLTDKGKARIASVEAPFAEHEARNATPLSAAEEATLKTLLKKYLGLSAPKGQ